MKAVGSVADQTVELAPPPTPPSRSPSGRTLAVRLPNWVGDVCMALPALDLLIGEGFAVTAFGRPWAADLLSGLPIAVRELPRGLGASSAVLRASGCRAALLFTNSFSSAVQMRLAGLRATGYRGDCRRFLLGTALERTSSHEVEAFWRLACAVAGPPTRPPPPAPHLPLTARHMSEAAAALDRAGVAAGFTVLCPLATGTAGGRSKEWPHFAALCRRLVGQGETVVACPGPGEQARAAAVLPGAVLLEELGLGAYGAVMARADSVVANDSGPLHLAVAVGAPALGIFGVSDPARTRPWSGRGAAVGDGRTWPNLEAVYGALQRLPRPGPA